jgi:hypothetical protein
VLHRRIIAPADLTTPGADICFDKQIQLRMGQAYVKRWIPDIMPLPD